jgi:Flp pilus assembly protein TadD
VLASLKVGDEVWLPGSAWWDQASHDEREQVNTAIVRLQRADRWGLASNAGALQDLVWLQLARGDADAAERTVRRLIERAPDQPEAYRGLAGIHRKAGRLAEAESAYRKALQVDPHYSRAGQDLAGLLLSQGRLDEAIEQLRRLIAQQPDPTSARYQLAIALLSRVAQPNQQPGDLEHAVDHLKQVVAERPNFPEAHYNLGVAIFMTGRPNEALPHIQESLRLNPNDPQANGFLDVIHRELAAPPSLPRGD